jgi:hypothetical protein
MGYSTNYLGWRASLPDDRDKPYRFGAALRQELVHEGDLPIEAHPQAAECAKTAHVDQGQSGSCTGEGTAFASAVERNVSQRSGAYIYWHARDLVGESKLDNGAYGRDACKVACTDGVPQFSKWPTVLDPQTLQQLHIFDPPSPIAEADAAKRKLFTYHGFDDADRAIQLRSCMVKNPASRGHLFMGGISVYDNIDDDLVTRFGIILKPKGNLQGGHWLPFTGYSWDFKNSEYAKWARDGGYPESQLPDRVFYYRNSWYNPKDPASTPWGRNGDGVIDAACILDPDLCDDLQTLRGFADERK